METVWTIGHSNRSFEEFRDLLAAQGIEQAADIRRYPASRKWPHFDAAALAVSLPAAGIAYLPMPELGGRRRARPDSPHTAWRSEAFRGYADFLDGPEAAAAVAKLEAAARSRPTAFFCAEAVPWRCHRSLVADRLTAGGWTVIDVLGPSSVRPHSLPDFARVESGRVIYDAGQLPLSG
ncbi:MAG TPA: DUF488 domain-containing protein [Thermoanaerobaculia bacterium]|nr:DUF488 domain-containing protein [Thermoanaerobaculia bacterium]